MSDNPVVSDQLKKAIIGTFDRSVVDAANKLLPKLNSRKLITYPEMILWGAVKVQNGLPVMLSYNKLTGQARPVVYSNFTDWKRAIAYQIAQLARDTVLTRPLPPTGEATMIFDVYIQTPKNFKESFAYLAETGAIRPVVKPDLDNIPKLIFDACKGILWADDACVTSIIMNKYYSLRPRTVLNCSIYEKKFK